MLLDQWYQTGSGRPTIPHNSSLYQKPILATKDLFVNYQFSRLSYRVASVSTITLFNTRGINASFIRYRTGFVKYPFLAGELCGSNWYSYIVSIVGTHRISETNAQYAIYEHSKYPFYRWALTRCPISSLLKT